MCPDGACECEIIGQRAANLLWIFNRRAVVKCTKGFLSLWCERHDWVSSG